MPLRRTQIYLEPSQHDALKRQARASDMSLAQLLRQIVSEHLSDGVPRFTKDEYMSIVDLGESGRDDVAENHDEHLAEILSDEHPR